MTHDSNHSYTVTTTEESIEPSDRRSGDDRRRDTVRIVPCSMHNDMPKLLGNLIANGEWLIGVTKVYMRILLLVIIAAFTAVIAINIQYNRDMAARDTIRNSIDEKVNKINARIAVIDKTLEYMLKQDTEIKDTLKEHMIEWKNKK